MISRRDFMAVSAASLGAGALGFSFSGRKVKGCNTEIQACFLSDEPIEIPARLISDPERNVFGIVCLENGRPYAEMKCGLDAIRKARADGEGVFTICAKRRGERPESFPVRVSLRTHTLFRKTPTLEVRHVEKDSPRIPAWIPLHDLDKVLA